MILRETFDEALDTLADLVREMWRGRPDQGVDVLRGRLAHPARA
jgi:hypothetical protein